MIKRLETFKSGPFTFSSEVDEIKISKTLIEARVLFQTINDLPILPELASNLDEELISRSIFGTAAIEGNPLGEDDVRNLLTRSGERKTTERARQEIINLGKAYKIISRTSPKAMEITEDLIKGIHETLTCDVDHKDNVPGSYRTHLVKVGNEEHGGIYTPPRVLDDVRNLMKAFVDWINSPEMAKEDPFVRSSLAHYHLCLVHPFGDGNGRTARLVESVILHSAGIKYVPAMLSNFYYRNIDDYYWAFSKTMKSPGHDTTPFVGFCLEGAVESLREIKERITWIIRKLAVRDYADLLRRNKEISQRQHDLLSLLLDFGGSFTHHSLHADEPFRILYRGVSAKTSARDLAKLASMRLLNVENRKYTLNLRALG